MTGLLMSDDGLNGFTESLDTTFDLATLVSPLCVKSRAFGLFSIRHFPPLQYYKLLVLVTWPFRQITVIPDSTNTFLPSTLFNVYKYQSTL